MTKPDSKVTTDSYDADDELTGVSYSDGTTHDVTYGYDPDGNVATMTDASGTSDLYLRPRRPIDSATRTVPGRPWATPTTPTAT